MNTYDFEFGFCIPNSTNTWESIYDVANYTTRDKKEYVSTLDAQFETRHKQLTSCASPAEPYS